MKDQLRGVFEVELPDPPLEGRIEASIHEVGETTEARIIGVEDAWEVDIDWYLWGALRRFICGWWCVQVIIDCMCDPCVVLQPDGRIPLDPCLVDENGQAHYHTTIYVPAGKVHPEPGECAEVCKVVIVVTYQDLCDRPGPIAGMVVGPLIQFYSEGDKATSTPTP